jgi:opacity protein-like surface antigen
MKILQFILVIIIILSQTVFSQQDSQQTKKDLQPKKIIRVNQYDRALINVQIGGDFSLVKFTKLNDHIAMITKNFHLPESKSLRNYYYLYGGVSVNVDEHNELRLLGGISLNKQNDSLSQNYLQIYKCNLTYLFHYPINNISVYAGPGIGMMFIRSETTFEQWNGSLLVNTNLLDAVAIIGVDYTSSNSMVIGIEGSYNYATTIHSNTTHLDFTFKGFQVGVKLTIPLF